MLLYKLDPQIFSGIGMGYGKVAVLAEKLQYVWNGAR